MRPLTSVVVAFAGVSVVAIFQGCSLVMDLDTDAYKPLPAPDGGDASAEAGLGIDPSAICKDSGLGLDFTCHSSAECGGTGVNCCLGPAGVSGAALCTLQATCTAFPCPSIGQLCATDKECGSGTCTLQTCSVDGLAIAIKNCGVIPGCNEISPADASGDAPGE
jgi:hypothetical protein